MCVCLCLSFSPHLSEGLRWTSHAFLTCSPRYVLRQHHSLSPELADWARLASQRVQGLFISASPELWLESCDTAHGLKALILKSALSF